MRIPSSILNKFRGKTRIWRKFKYPVATFVFIFISTFNLGSRTDGIYFSEKYEMYFNRIQNRFNNLILEFDQYMQHTVDESMSPGAAVAVVYKGSIMLLKGYGVKESGTNDRIDENTVFRVGSVSKGFASVLSGLMVNEGYFDWDDAIVSHLNDFTMKDSTYSDSLTIRHILSHTSGLPVHAYTDMLDAGVPYEKIRELLAELSFAYKPGEVYTYQNAVYSLIGDVLNQVSGKSYSTLMKEKIFLPLNMSHASADFLSFSQNSNTAMPHIRTKSGWMAKTFNERYYSVAPASGINASASDMAEWLLALTGNSPEIIPSQTIQEVTKTSVYTPLLWQYRSTWTRLQKTSYGMGWRIFKFRDHDIIYHGGYVEGYKTEIAFDPAEEIGFVVLLNSNTSFASSCIPNFVEMFLEQEKETDPVELSTRLFPVLMTREQ